MSKSTISKLTSKGREAVRGSLGLSEGDRLLWETTGEGRVEVRRMGGSLAALVGLLGEPRCSATIAEMDDSVKRRFRIRATRG